MSATPIEPEVGNGPWGSVADTLADDALEQEWLLEGEATRYRLLGEYRFDGRWSVEPAATAPYRVRMLSLRPAADRFNGIVVVSWNNVSAGFDGLFAGPAISTMLEEGYAFVGVSVQFVGVHGERGLVASDPARYGTLIHPGDDYSYGIFTQAAAAASGRHGNAEVLGGLMPRVVVASGASQSAARLATVHNALHPVGLIDAYHLPVYFGNGTVIDSTGGEAAVPGGSPNWPMMMLAYGSHLLRQDLGVPVFVVNSETEGQVFTTNKQPDSAHLVIWENAGASHIGGTSGENRFGLPEARCRGSFFPAQHAVWHHLRGWLEEGRIPPSQPRFERSPDGWLARDVYGNARGGIRWPHVVVPLGTHGAAPPTDGQPDRMGFTTAFEPERVRQLYGTREEYEKRFADAVANLVATGVVLPEDVASVGDPLARIAWGD